MQGTFFLSTKDYSSDHSRNWEMVQQLVLEFHMHLTQIWFTESHHPPKITAYSSKGLLHRCVTLSNTGVTLVWLALQDSNTTPDLTLKEQPPVWEFPQGPVNSWAPLRSLSFYPLLYLPSYPLSSYPLISAPQKQRPLDVLVLFDFNEPKLVSSNSRANHPGVFIVAVFSRKSALYV